MSSPLCNETVVPAPPIETPQNITTFAASRYGKNILLLIPTRNRFKRNSILTRVEEAVLEAEYAARLIVQVKEVESGVGEQPYDEKGLEGAYNRIRNALGWLERNQHVLRENMVGTVLVCAIENYIERRSPPEGAAAVDYGIVAVYSATACKLAVAISRGVTVPQAYLKEAEDQGYDDDERKCGKVTVGRILARNFGLDAANWHEVVCGTSRYALLEEALRSLDLKSMFLDFRCPV